MLNKDNNKLEPHTEARLFVGYANETKYDLLYSTKDQKVIISTNARVLE